MRLAGIRGGLIIIIFFLATGHNVAAQEYARQMNVYTSTYMYFDRDNGIMYGTAEASMDYTYSVYYDLSVNATLEGDNGDADYEGGYASGQYGTPDVIVYTALPAWAGVNYTVTGDYTVDFGFEDEYAYFDYYDFSQYATLFVDAPDFYDFYASLQQNPYYGGGSSYSHLGKTHSSKYGGTPDHLWVVSDDINSSGFCGRTERNITYQIVDSDNKKTGRAPVSELFDHPLTDTCSGFNVEPSTCFPNYLHAGWIEDVLHVGLPGGQPVCPESIDPDCGSTNSFDHWQWCPHGDGGSKKTIGTFTYDVRWNRIGINGLYTRWPQGGQFFP